MEKFERRDFLRKASVGVAGGVAALAGCSPASNEKSDAPAVHTKMKFEWKMVTTWPPHFPILGEGADLLAKWIDEIVRRATENYGLRRWRVDSAARRFRCRHPGNHRDVPRRAILLGRQSACYAVFRGGSIWNERTTAQCLDLQRRGVELWQELYARSTLSRCPWAIPAFKWAAGTIGK